MSATCVLKVSNCGSCRSKILAGGPVGTREHPCYNHLMRLYLLIPLSLIVGCSFFEKRNTTQTAAPEVKDLPYEARDPEGGLRHRVLVLPFLLEKPGQSEKVADEARRTVIRELARTGQFVMVSPEDFPQDPKKFLTPEGDYDLEQLSRIAAGVGVAAVLECKVLNIRARKLGDQVGLIRQVKAHVDAQIRLRMFAGKNGREVLNDVRSASVDSATTRVAESSFSDRYLEEDPELVRQAVRKAVTGSIPGVVRAVEKLSWEGRVAMVSGERVFINAGRLSGIQIGDVLKITDEGDEVFDPETGRFIGKAPGRMKGTIEVTTYFGKDGAIGIVHSGSGFKENDRVELY